MTSVDGSVTYAYCLLSARRPPPRGRQPRGLPGTGPVRALDLGAGLRLIVGDAPLSRYGREPIAEGLRDLGWVSSCAMAHERVVEHFARHGTVIPMKLFTLFAGDQRATDHIRRSLARVRRLLTQIADRRAEPRSCLESSARDRLCRRSSATLMTRPIGSMRRWPVTPTMRDGRHRLRPAPAPASFSMPPSSCPSSDEPPSARPPGRR